MIEQSTLNGPLYLSEDGTTTTAPPKVVKPGDISFGPPTEVVVEKGEYYNDFYLEDRTKGETFHYVDGVNQGLVDHPVLGASYLMGVAEIGNVLHQYMIQNEPPVSREDTLDRQHLQAPASIIGFPYDQVFTFPRELGDVIGDLPATYVDKRKRPLNYNLMMERGVYLPTNIKKTPVTAATIMKEPKHFPMVVDLEGTELAVVDLEPGYSTEDLTEVEKYSILYQEDTPRGGKHYLVRTKNKEYKFRVSKHLEIINDTMCTFYGINGVVRDTNAPYTDFSVFDYEEVGRNRLEVHQASEQVLKVVEKLKQLNVENKNLGREAALNVYTYDDDLSHADYMAMWYLYRLDIQPFVSELLDNGIPSTDLPWILAEYAAHVIPGRDKHYTNRLGVPYLVYVATSIVKRMTNDL